VVSVPVSNVDCSSVALGKTALSVSAMASDEPKLPLGPWLFGRLQLNPPNADLNIIELQIRRIQLDTGYCLLEIGQERTRRARQEARSLVRAAQVEWINSLSKSVN
jgi:hypothetical protein